MKPMFVKEIKHGGKVIEKFKPTTINRKICSRRTIDSLQSLLEGVVSRGTAKLTLSNTPYLIAGKTGTAQIAEGNKGYNKRNYNASFVGYFPADNPKYSCIVVVNNPSQGRIYGSSVAAPVFKEIADKVYATQLDLHSDNPKLLANKFPSRVMGHKGEIKEVLGKLNIPTKNASITDWTRSVLENDTMFMNGFIQYENLIPNVKGMGAKDAIYMLELVGVKVKVIGKGKVSSQSLRAGTRIKKGQEIILNLAS